MLGCDYCDSVKGVGPAKAIALIRDHRNIEEILKQGKVCSLFQFLSVCVFVCVHVRACVWRGYVHVLAVCTVRVVLWYISLTSNSHFV